MARLALGVAGAAIGGAAFGPTGMSIGWTVGTTVGTLLFPEKIPDTQGPRLGDLTVTSATDGSDMPILWGTQRAAGQIIWADKIKEKKHEESAGGKGGSTGTYTTFSYFATFAISFGAFQASAVRRIWANKRLIYDARPETKAIKGKGLKFTLYKGTETQTADPTIENKVGTGNAPAFRGQTYMVFRNLPLEKYGNRIPSIEAELVIGGTSSTSLTSVDAYTTSALNNAGRQFSLSNGLVYQSYFSASGYSVVVGIEPHTKAIKYDYAANTYTSQALAGNFIGGDFTEEHLLVYQVNGTARNFEVWTSAQTWVQNFDGGSNNLNGSMIDVGGETDGSVVLYRTNAYRCWPKTGTTGYAVASVPSGYSLLTTFGHTAIKGGISALIPLYRTSDNAVCFSVFTPEAVASGGTWGTPVVDSTYTTSTLSILDDAVYCDTTDQYFWPAQYTDGSNYPALVATDAAGNIEEMYDLRDYAAAENGTFSATVRPILSFDSESGYITFSKAGYFYFWDAAREELTYVSGLSSKVEWPFYHNQTDTAITGDLDNSSKVSVDFLRVNGVNTATVDAADIVTDVCALAGIPAASLNLTGYTDTVRGYRHSRRTTARSDIEPLLAVTNADAVQSDWKLKVVPRGGSSADTIASADLNARQFGQSGDSSLVTQKLPQNVDLPRSLNLHYMSSDADYQIGNALVQWFAGSSERRVTTNVPVVMSDQEALDQADRLLMQAHEQEIYTFNLPRGYGALEPTDVITLPVGGENYRVRVVSVERGANGLLSFVAITDDAAHLTADTEAGEAQVDEQIVETTSQGIPMIVQTSLLRDEDMDNIGPYITAFTYAAGFQPMGIYRSIAGADYELIGSVTTEPIIGVVNGALSNEVIDGFDTTNTLTVDVINNGTLSTRTDAEILSGMNAAIVGNNVRWEVVQFVNATATDSDTWELTRLLRYRRGTDRKLVDGGVSIQDGDWFIMLDDRSAWFREPIAYSEVTKTYSYKAVPFDTSVDDAEATSVTIGAYTLKPYSGAEPSVAWTGTGATAEATVTWTRRTRRGGSLGGTNGYIDGVGGPISEDSEEYEIDIYDPSDDSIVRQITGLSSPSYVYTAANRVTDGLTTDVGFTIYQISATVDRGWPIEVEDSVP